jgi:hypothetical protein
MKAADPLALRLTFELIRRAEKQPWIACLETEFAVARRLLEVSELELRIFKNSSQYSFVNEYSNQDATAIPQAVIDGFFAPAEGEYKFEHDVPSHALLPVNDYFSYLPDSVRAYLNR